MKNFPEEIINKLGFYVYRLVDPRNGHTFYIGKGVRNRVFQHGQSISATAELDDGPISLKLQTIKEIKLEGLEPLHIIHRHGLSEKEAFLAEAVLIDAYPGLANEVIGHGSADFGPASVEQLIIRYQADEMVIPENVRIMAINVRLSYRDSESVYQAVRCAWRISKSRAARADYVLAMIQGICRGVFQPLDWVAADKESFPFLESSRPDRIGFHGVEASDVVKKEFLMKRLPAHMQRRKGMASPVLYSYK